MATRALSNLRKISFVGGLSRAIFGSRSFGTAMHSSPSSTTGLWGLGGLLQRNLSCSPASQSVLSQPHCQSSLGMSWLSQSKRSFSASGVYPNMRMRFQKQRRNRGEMKGTSDNHISFGKYGLEALEPAWITAKQITAGQLAIKRNMRGGKLFLRIFPHKPISLKPAETRMGRGKGNVAFWVAGIRAGRILFEIDGVPESVARRAITVASSKMPIKTRFVKFSG